MCLKLQFRQRIADRQQPLSEKLLPNVPSNAASNPLQSVAAPPPPPRPPLPPVSHLPSLGGNCALPSTLSRTLTILDTSVWSPLSLLCSQQNNPGQSNLSSSPQFPNPGNTFINPNDYPIPLNCPFNIAPSPTVNNQQRHKPEAETLQMSQYLFIKQWNIY